MHTKESLMADLKNAGINPKGTLLIHVSLKSIGAVEGGADTVLDALCEYMKDGLFVMPTHTWSNVNTDQPIYNVKDTPVCIGALPEIFRKRKGVVRSLHPTHSLAAIGRDAVDFLRGQDRFDTPCAPDSAYGELYRRNAQVLLIGVTFACNTSVHCAEEFAKVQGRIKSTSESFVVIDERNTASDCPAYRHDNANSNLYVKLEPVMEHRGTLSTISFGDAKSLSFNEKDLFETTLELLEKNTNLLSDDKPVPKEWW